MFTLQCDLSVAVTNAASGVLADISTLQCDLSVAVTNAASGDISTLHYTVIYLNT